MHDIAQVNGPAAYTTYAQIHTQSGFLPRLLQTLNLSHACRTLRCINNPSSFAARHGLEPEKAAVPPTCFFTAPGLWAAQAVRSNSSCCAL